MRKRTCGTVALLALAAFLLCAGNVSSQGKKGPGVPAPPPSSPEGKGPTSSGSGKPPDPPPPSPPPQDSKDSPPAGTGGSPPSSPKPPPAPPPSPPSVKRPQGSLKLPGAGEEGPSMLPGAPGQGTAAPFAGPPPAPGGISVYSSSRRSIALAPGARTGLVLSGKNLSRVEKATVERGGRAVPGVRVGIQKKGDTRISLTIHRSRGAGAGGAATLVLHGGGGKIPVEGSVFAIAMEEGDSGRSIVSPSAGGGARKGGGGNTPAGLKNSPGTEEKSPPGAKVPTSAASEGEDGKEGTARVFGSKVTGLGGRAAAGDGGGKEEGDGGKEEREENSQLGVFDYLETANHPSARDLTGEKLEEAVGFAGKAALIGGELTPKTWVTFEKEGEDAALVEVIRSVDTYLIPDDVELTDPRAVLDFLSKASLTAVTPTPELWRRRAEVGDEEALKPQVKENLGVHPDTEGTLEEILGATVTAQKIGVPQVTPEFLEDWKRTDEGGMALDDLLDKWVPGARPGSGEGNVPDLDGLKVDQPHPEGTTTDGGSPGGGGGGTGATPGLPRPDRPDPHTGGGGGGGGGVTPDPAGGGDSAVEPGGGTGSSGQGEDLSGSQGTPEGSGAGAAEGPGIGTEPSGQGGGVEGSLPDESVTGLEPGSYGTTTHDTGGDGFTINVVDVRGDGTTTAATAHFSFNPETGLWEDDGGSGVTFDSRPEEGAFFAGTDDSGQDYLDPVGSDDDGGGDGDDDGSGGDGDSGDDGGGGDDGGDSGGADDGGGDGDDTSGGGGSGDDDGEGGDEGGGDDGGDDGGGSDTSGGDGSDGDEDETPNPDADPNVPVDPEAAAAALRERAEQIRQSLTQPGPDGETGHGSRDMPTRDEIRQMMRGRLDPVILTTGEEGGEEQEGGGPLEDPRGVIEQPGPDGETGGQPRPDGPGSGLDRDHPGGSGGIGPDPDAMMEAGGEEER